MIRINNLEKKLSPEFSVKIPSLTIEDGERVALIGPNGSGKSTLLRLIAGLIKPDSGSIDVTAQKDSVGYLPQDPFVFKGTTEYNIRLATRDFNTVNSVLSACELSDFRYRKTDRLSGGEKQRLCVARTLAGNDRLLLLDEPLSAADIETGETLCRVLREYCEKNGATLLMATHLPRQAFDIATKFLILHQGEIAEYGDVRTLRDPKSEFGKRFLSQWKLE